MALKKYTKTAQLYNKDGTDTNNGFVNRAYLNTIGNVGDSANHTISEYIDISAFEQITISGTGATSTSITNVFYNANYEKVSYFATDVVPKTVNVPSNAKYIRMTVANVRKDTLMLNSGSTAIDYEPYGSAWNTKSYCKATTGSKTYSNFPIVVRSQEQSIPTWTMDGNTETSGTPSPSNAVAIDGVGNKTSNLLNVSMQNIVFYNDYPSSTYDNFTINNNVVTLEANEAAFFSMPAKVEENTTYYVRAKSLSGTGFTYRVRYYSDLPNNRSDNFISTAVNTTIVGTYTNTLTTSQNCKYILIELYHDPSQGEQTVGELMVDTNSTNYEPYGYKIPISANGTALTPIYLTEQIMKIGDYVDSLTSSSMVTRNVIKQVFTGQENWNIYSAGTDVSFFYLVLAGAVTGRNSLIICTHFERKAVDTVSNVVGIDLVSSGTIIRLRPPNVATDYSSTTAWKQWLADQYAAGTPVTVWYVLATPTTEQVTVPTIPTTSSPTTIDVNTSVKPSEMSLTYNGWRINKHKRKSANLFNKATALANIAISDSSGNAFSYNGVNASDYINVSGMNKVSITNTLASRWGAFYDTNKAFVSGFNGYGTINVPQNAVYMRITVTDAFLDSCMVNEGETLLPYVPYWE